MAANMSFMVHGLDIRTHTFQLMRPHDVVGNSEPQSEITVYNEPARTARGENAVVTRPLTSLLRKRRGWFSCRRPFSVSYIECFAHSNG